MKGLFVKLISVLLILALFSGCMTVGSDNRSEAITEFRKAKTISISRVPIENDAGPVFSISASSNNAALMVAGQTGLELNYKYFIMVDSHSDSFISGGGYMYQGTGGSSISTSYVYTITVAYTNDESLESKYNVYECSSLLDGYTFVTQGGKVALWTLFGTTLAGGSILMISGAALDWDDPQWEQKFIGRMAGGGALMLGSLLFTIPLW